MKKNIFLALTLSLLLFTAGSAFAATEETNATPQNTPKEEIIYANLSYYGTAEHIYVINSFHLEENGNIRDYGKYSKTENLTSLAAIHKEGDAIDISAEAGNFYYQGQLDQAELPWEVTIRYLLDGETISAEDLAGQSGHLEVSIQLTQNPLADPFFFENYALQLSVTLSEQKATNILAEDAVRSSAGKEKTLSYIIFSNQETTVGFSADVNDFEMDGIQIAGISLSFSADDFDSSEFTDDLKDLQDGIIELNDGVLEFHDGVVELNDAVQELDDGTTELSSHTVDLAKSAGKLRDASLILFSGARELQDGITTFQEGVAELDDGCETLAVGLSAYKGALEEYAQGFQSALDGYAPLFSGAEALQDGSVQFLSSLALSVAEAQTALSEAEANLELASIGLTSVENYLSQAENGLAQAEGYVALAQDALDEAMAQLEAAETPEEQEAAAAVLQTAIASYEGAVTAYESAVAAYQNVVANLGVAYSAYGMASAGVQAAEASLAGLQELYSSYESYIHNSILSLESGLNGEDGLQSTLITLSQAAEELADGAEELAEGASELSEGTYALTDGAGELSDGAEELTDGLWDYFTGMEEFTEGSYELSDGAQELSDGTGELAEGTSDLEEGSEELKDGTGQLQEETSGMDEEMDQRIRDLLEEYGGRDFTPISFVSAKNTEVLSVQFVLKTPDLTKAEEPEEEVQEESASTLWDKIKALKVYGDKLAALLRRVTDWTQNLFATAQGVEAPPLPYGYYFLH